VRDHNKDGTSSNTGAENKFKLHSVMVRGGRFARLSRTEMIVWQAYWDHADTTLLSWPSPKTIAGYLGHSNDCHVRQAIKSLEDAGLLERLPGAGGNHDNTLRVRLLFPGQKSPTHNATQDRSTPLEIRVPLDATPVQSTVLGSGMTHYSESDADTTPVQMSIYKEEQINEEINDEQIINPPIAPQGAQVENERSLKEPSFPGFDRFWDSWPKHRRKYNRDGCLKIWKNKNLEALADEILASLERSKTCHDWQKEAGNYIPAPAVWLNQKRWEAPLTDDIPVGARVYGAEAGRHAGEFKSTQRGPIPCEKFGPDEMEASPHSDEDEIPESLRTEPFISTWPKWKKYHEEMGRPLRTSTIKAQLVQLEKVGVSSAVQTIENSICQGYTGLVPPTLKGKDDKYDHRAAKRAREYPQTCNVEVFRC